MATVNVTFRGRSADMAIDIGPDVTDDEIKRMAHEMIRSGGLPGMHIHNLRHDTFDHYVVDRFEDQGRIYLRPKVPFGARR